MKTLIFSLLFVSVMSFTTTVWAAPVTFTYSGTAIVTGAMFNGSFTIDDALFNGSSSQNILNSSITAFDFLVQHPMFGNQSWDFNDLNTTAFFTFDSSGAIPDVIGAGGPAGSGFTASNSTPSNLSFSGPNFVAVTDFGPGFGGSGSGDWTAASPVPTPSAMLLMGSGLIGLIGWRWWTTPKNV